MIDRFKKVTSHPATKEALKSLKPERNFWGIFSVIFLFILPEIVAFIWGGEITTYAQQQLLQNLPLEQEYYYKGLEMLFGEGSWFNLLFGVGLLIWLFF
jgi:hypothetical protein